MKIRAAVLERMGVQPPYAKSKPLSIVTLDLAPPGRNGEYMGAYSSMFSLSMVIGPWAGAAALDRFGPTVMWTSVFICGIVAMLIVALSGERVVRDANDPSTGPVSIV